MKRNTRSKAKLRRREAKDEVRRQLRDSQPDWKDEEDAEARRLERLYSDIDDVFIEPGDGRDDWYDDESWLYNEEDYDEWDEYWDEDWMRIFSYVEGDCIHDDASDVNGDLADNLRTLVLYRHKLTSKERVQVDWMIARAASIARRIKPRY